MKWKKDSSWKARSIPRPGKPIRRRKTLRKFPVLIKESLDSRVQLAMNSFWRSRRRRESSSESSCREELSLGRTSWKYRTSFDDMLILLMDCGQKIEKVRAERWSGL